MVLRRRWLVTILGALSFASSACLERDPAFDPGASGDSSESSESSETDPSTSTTATSTTTTETGETSATGTTSTSTTASTTSGCPSGEVDCGQGCVDLQTSDEHCGTCGSFCQDGFSCVGGSCLCDQGSPCAGQCVDLDTSEEHCGRCDNACPGDQACSGGRCG